MIALYIILWIIVWIFMWVTSMEVLTWRFKWGNDTVIGAIFVAPIMFIIAIFLILYDIDYSEIRIFNKKTPTIDWYTWWDLIKYWLRDGIYLAPCYLSDCYVLLKWETWAIRVSKESIEPVITWEVAEELKLFKEAQELEKKWKEFIAQAEKVRKQQAKIKNILN